MSKLFKIILQTLGAGSVAAFLIIAAYNLTPARADTVSPPFSVCKAVYICHEDKNKLACVKRTVKVYKF